MQSIEKPSGKVYTRNRGMISKPEVMNARHIWTLILAGASGVTDLGVGFRVFIIHGPELTSAISG